MIRQAHTYLVGALSGVTLIGIAIGVFVVLVSAQVFHDWPIAELGGHSQKAAVAPAKALPAPAEAGAAGAAANTARRSVARAGAGIPPRTPKADHHHAAADPGAVAGATGPATVVETTPSGGHESPSRGDSGSQPTSTPPSQSPTASNPGGGSAGSSDGSTTGTGSSGSSGPTGGHGTGTTVPPVTAATNPAQVVTEAVNETVHEVDEKVLGGTLEKTGVTEVTESVVHGVAGPGSAVGKTVEGVGEVVGGLLGAGGH